MKDFLKRVSSRKFIAALLPVILIVIGWVNPDLTLSAEELLLVIAPIMAFIGAEGWKDVEQERKSK